MELHESRMNSGTVHFSIRSPECAALSFEASFPRQCHHCYFVDANDHLLLEDIVLDLGSLHGWRILTPTDQRAELRLRLQADDAPRQPIVFEVANETSLSQLLPRLRGLLAIGGPDSELRMRVMVGASQSRRIKLRRYLRDGAWNGTALTLGNDNENVDKDGLSAQIVNLRAPDLNTDIKGLYPGDEFMAQLPEHAGPWMVFAQDSEGLVRPPRPLVKEIGMAPVVAPRFSEPFFPEGAFHAVLTGLLRLASCYRGCLIRWHPVIWDFTNNSSKTLAMERRYPVLILSLRFPRHQNSRLCSCCVRVPIVSPCDWSWRA